MTKEFENAYNYTILKTRDMSIEQLEAYRAVLNSQINILKGEKAAIQDALNVRSK